MLIGVSIGALHWIAAGLFLILISAVVVQQRRARPYLLVGWLWFLVTLLPVIGLLQVGDQAMADRYSYLPSIGLVVALVWFVDDWVGHSKALRWTIGTATAAILSALFVSSAIQIRYWRDTKTLFTHANSVTDRNYLARTTLAYALIKSPEHREEAIQLARSAVEICPERPYPHHVLAAVLEEQGQYPEALSQYQAALKEDPFDALTHSDLGGLLVKMGRDDRAIKQFTIAIDLDPSKSEARHNLAIVLANHNHLDEAITQWKQAIRYDPQDGEIQGWLAEALRVHGDRAGAIKHYRAAFAAGERNPTWESNFAWFVATDPGSSDDELEQAVSVSKDAVDQTGQAMALDAMAAALARTGRFDDAADAAQRAIVVAKAQGKLPLANEIQLRLNAYRAGRSYLVQNATTRATE
jgi:tetratricopeptide (TPR) repeat protein